MRQFYPKLYLSECDPADTKISKFLGKVTLLCLSEEQQATLNAPISQKEVQGAIASLKGGKAPGPDGFCPEFIRNSHLVAGPLTDMFVLIWVWPLPSNTKPGKYQPHP